MKPESMSRRQVRYWLFRKQNEAAGGALAKGCPKGFAAKFEDQPVFVLAGGYPTFGNTWDVDKSDRFKIVPRRESIADQWNAHLNEAAKPLPGVD